jgi:hypothetical protein
VLRQGPVDRTAHSTKNGLDQAAPPSTCTART